MIGSTRAVEIFACRQPVDMRKQYDSLAAIVIASMGRDPHDGTLYLFVGRDRRRAKVLYFDGTGVCVFANQPSSHYTSSVFSRGPWFPRWGSRIAAARSERRSQRLQCFVGRVDGSS